MTETHLEFYKRWGQLARPYFQWQYDQFSDFLGRKVADVGCGLGNFVPFLLDRDLYLGLEPDPELVREFGNIHKSSNVRLASCGDITDPASVNELKQNQIDSVICVNVIEHIEADLRAFTHMVEGVSQGGSVCILVPAMQILYGTLDKLDGHYRRYSRSDLLRLTDGLPVQVVRLYYLNFVGAFGWFLKGRILKQSAQSDSNYSAMNRILPVISKLENWVKPPIGLSLVLILRKT